MLDLLDGISEGDLADIIQANTTAPTDARVGQAVLEEVRRDPHTTSLAVVADVAEVIDELDVDPGVAP